MMASIGELMSIYRQHANESGCHIRVQKWLKIYFLLVACLLGLYGCTPSVPEDCPPFPSQEGSVYVTGEGGVVKLKIPSWANVYPTYDCKQARSVVMHYVWYNKKLYPADGKSDKNIPREFYNLIYIDIESFGEEKKWGAIMRDRVKSWQYAYPISHRTLPLVMYPRYFWKSPEDAPSRVPDDIRWGVKNTKNPIDGRLFSVSCSIVPVDKNIQTSAIDGGLHRGGDSKCAGGIAATKAGKAIDARIYVWAATVPEIDLVFNSVASELTNFIQEE